MEDVPGYRALRQRFVRGEIGLDEYESCVRTLMAGRVAADARLRTEAVAAPPIRASRGADSGPKRFVLRRERGKLYLRLIGSDARLKPGKIAAVFVAGLAVAGGLLAVTGQPTYYDESAQAAGSYSEPSNRVYRVNVEGPDDQWFDVYDNPIPPPPQGYGEQDFYDPERGRWYRREYAPAQEKREPAQGSDVEGDGGDVSEGISP